jgi:predicted ATPase
MPLGAERASANRAVQGLRIIISGGPGTGKSTLLAALARQGEVCYEEVSRQVIREQKAQNGRLLPWFNLEPFAQECLGRMQAQLLDSRQHDRAFFDRGLPDVAGYMRHGGLTPPELRIASRAYSPLVFFAPPWREIFVNDTERPQTYDVSLALSAQIRRAYVEFGFRVIELEKASVETRLDYVLEEIHLLKKADCTWAA